MNGIRGWLAVALIAWGGMTASALAAENVWSIDYFNSRKSEWNQLIGATIRIEGRVSLAGGGQLRLVKCEIPVFASDPMIRPLLPKKAVEVTGRLQKVNGKLILEADRIETIPTDLEQYRTRTSKLRNASAADWYEVGDWAIERSKFYEDADLAEKARQAYEHGVNAAWRNLEADDAQGRFQLAQKVADYKLPDSRRLELIHEGHRINWNRATRARTVDVRELAKLAADLKADLPGSTQPLTPFPEQLAARYEREPLKAYHESDDTVRRQLHRLFYISLLLKTIQEGVSEDGRDGDIIAARLEAQVPEAKLLVEQYRTRKLNWRLEQAATATRPEIEQLAADFRARQQPDQARQALTRWFQAREPRLREDGALGLLQLADESLSLLRDERRAVALLAEAHKLDPAFADVLEKLKSLGYVNVGGTWVKSNPAAAPPGGMDTTVPETLRVGMNGVAVRDAMGGRPGTLGRVVTKSGVAEVWAYGPPGSSRLIIRLEGSRLSPELRVVDIQNER